MNTSSTPRNSGPVSRLIQSWQRLSPRERRLVGIAALVVAAGSVLGLLDWSHTQRERLQRTLPRAAAQLEQVQEAASEIARLRSTPPLPPSTTRALLEGAQASARSRGLSLTVQASGEGLHISGQAGFDELVSWLATLQKDQGLRVFKMEIQRQDHQATVDALLGRSDG
ncbi:type II secretion system protein GspM [Zoogloea sp.]|uniref:type II secretion system protein GspM n=1 Tax=Zoogloea sp. TaxID=49181 RepID=UPI0026178537|nr:type II secretion system protein GspM [Zoogloea sp.]MDD3354604.1 type II secretion system protein GspM [Zoogloea sp.]